MSKKQNHPSAKKNRPKKDHKPHCTLSKAIAECTLRFLSGVNHDRPHNVMQQAELAHWYYLDELCEAYPKLPRLPLQPFVLKLLQHYDQSTSGEAKAMLRAFQKRKAKLPVCGAALLDPTGSKVVMVKGTNPECPWGFPKGKIEPGEEADLASCAAREVWEETGLVVQLSSAPLVQGQVGGKTMHLFLAMLPRRVGRLAPRTKGEIGQVDWVPVETLRPGGSEDVSQVMAAPFYRSIVTWAQQHRKPPSCSLCWCQHESCLESTRVFPHERALQRHMRRTHAP